MFKLATGNLTVVKKKKEKVCEAVNVFSDTQALFDDGKLELKEDKRFFE